MPDEYAKRRAFSIGQIRPNFAYLFWRMVQILMILAMSAVLFSLLFALSMPILLFAGLGGVAGFVFWLLIVLPFCIFYTLRAALRMWNIDED